MNTLSNLVLATIFLAASGAGQDIPTDKEDLLNSAGSGMARYADLNGYPGPKHVLEFSRELALTDEQLETIHTLVEEMKAGARVKGEEVIREEEELNRLFEGGHPDEETVIRISREIGRLRGELRAIHLVAHLKCQKVLTDEQMAAYDRLRHGGRKDHSGHH